jgi:hypothetical protein
MDLNPLLMTWLGMLWLMSEFTRSTTALISFKEALTYMNGSGKTDGILEILQTVMDFGGITI